MKKDPAQARSKATVEAILTAAARILLDVGYDKASTNKIADMAGVSIGSLYEYFPGKEAIFAEIRRREDQRLYKLTMDRPTPASMHEIIELHVSIYLQFVRSNLELHAALIKEVPHYAVGKDELPFYREYVPWTAEFFAAHRNELRHGHRIEQVAEFSAWVARSTIDNYVLHSPETLKGTVIEELLTDILNRFLLPDSPSS